MPAGSQASIAARDERGRMDLAVDALLADPARDQLRELRAEVEDQDAIAECGSGRHQGLRSSCWIGRSIGESAVADGGRVAAVYSLGLASAADQDLPHGRPAMVSAQWRREPRRSYRCGAGCSGSHSRRWFRSR